ncbi:MAG: hypothetical protein QW292_11940 [Candidatus Parvarchaeota archaeon]
MKPVDCLLYDKCECPLCPLEEDSVSVWYSEDEICKNPQFQVITNSMKKLKRKEAQGYFTLEMLNRDFIVRKGTEGLDPDLLDSIRDPQEEYTNKERTWLRKHPEISKERKKEMRERGLKSIQSIKNTIPHPSISEMIDLKGDVTRLSRETSKRSVQNEGCRK